MFKKNFFLRSSTHGVHNYYISTLMGGRRGGVTKKLTKQNTYASDLDSCLAKKFTEMLNLICQQPLLMVFLCRAPGFICDNPNQIKPNLKLDFN